MNECMGTPDVKAIVEKVERLLAEEELSYKTELAIQELLHSSGAVCSPTRAGLVTGRYQQRVSIPGVVYADPKRLQHRHGLQSTPSSSP